MNSLKTKNNTVYFPERLTHHTVAELCQKIEFIYNKQIRRHSQGIN